MEKILVIDDDKPTLMMFRLTLGAYGFEVLTAENGQEGLEIFSHDRPCIVLTDIKMPGMNGIEVLKRIKEIDPTAEVIVITGHGDMDLAIQALNLDATDFINKPIQRHLLEQALERARERQRLSAEQIQEIVLEPADDAAVLVIRGNITAKTESRFQALFHEAAALQKPRIVLNFLESAVVNGAPRGGGRSIEKYEKSFWYRGTIQTRSHDRFACRGHVRMTDLSRTDRLSLSDTKKQNRIEENIP